MQHEPPLLLPEEFKSGHRKAPEYNGEPRSHIAPSD